MKTSKISLVAVLALSLTLGLAASSLAGPGGGMGGGMGCGMMGAMNLTPDQAGKFFDLKEKFHSDTAPLRKQMMIKRTELVVLQKAEKPDQAAITAKQAEMKALWAQMQEKRTAFQAEAGKISPDLGKGFGRGMHGGMGHGRGMGPDGCPMAGPGGGKAAGCCPMAPGGAPAPSAPAK
jgi:Spy/CpxP family protein refolding chaperone